MCYDADYCLWGHHPEPMPKSEIVEFTGLLKSIGEHVERAGGDRDSVLRELQEESDKTLEEDTIEVVDAFLAGLRD